MSPIHSPHRFNSSFLLWRCIEHAGLAWGQLDKLVHNGRHHALLDETMSRIRGSNVFFPYRFYQEGFGDFTLPAAFYAWLEAFAKETTTLKERTFKTWLPRIPAINLAPSLPGPNGTYFQEGTFRTTAIEISHRLPPESVEAKFLIVSSEKDFLNGANRNPCVVMLAGTGDQGYTRRAYAAVPLAQRSNIASIILESPFYGYRKPPKQIASKLRHVSDLIILGRATIEESLSILQWLAKDARGPELNNLAVAGISMGGLHSAMTASLSPLPLGVVSWLGPACADSVFTEGLLSLFCDWKKLQMEVGKDVDVKQVLKSFLSLTDISHFPSPVNPNRSIFVLADNDRYVLPEIAIKKWMEMRENKWKGSRVEIISGGHVSAAIFRTEQFRRCIEHVLNVRELGNLNDVA